MNNLIKYILNLTDDTSKWSYINRKGKVIICTKKQFWSYIKKRKINHEKIMKKAIDTLFAPFSLYYRVKNKKKPFI
jgi:hypothetical protein